jgi:DNA-binding NarL/FixJ family response regulator
MSAPTVLLIHGDEDVRHALSLLFEMDGFGVAGEASNGADGVALARSHEPDFVVVDDLMPRLGGEGTAQVLRALAPASKIVAFSATLDHRPSWADAFLNADRISEVVPALRAMIPRTARLAYS